MEQKFIMFYAQKTKEDGTTPEDPFSQDNLLRISPLAGDKQVESVFVQVDYTDTDTLTVYKVQFLNVMTFPGTININTYNKTTQKWDFTSVTESSAKWANNATQVSNALTLTKGDTTTKFDGSTAQTVSIPTKTSELTNDSNFTTQTDLDNLTNTVVSYNAQENITDEQKAQARTNIGAISEAELVQSDWNQNDETAKDYIKNRICYKAPDELLGEITFTATSENTMTYTTTEDDITLFRKIDPLVGKGEVIKAIVDGKNCMCSVTFDRGYFYFHGEFSGSVYYNPDKTWNATITNDAVSLTTGQTYPVQFYHTGEIVKIPDEFLSDKVFEHPVSRGTGLYSIVDGHDTTASGDYSHASGANTRALGIGSFAEGSLTTASGAWSHAEGTTTTASGSKSHAEGNLTTASGNSSHSEGYNTIASGDYSHVEGTSNIEDTANKYVNIVGNGTSGNARSNAHTLDWSGNAWYAGDVYVGSR